MNDFQNKYERPQIIRIGHPLYVKHGLATTHSQPILSEIEGHSIEKLLKEFGSPLFIFSEKQMISQFSAAKLAFESRYPSITFGWSYKTNYISAICSLFHKQGAIAEVVSEFEYEKARSLGIPGNQIIFNGPLKSLKILERAVCEGAKIHIDSTEEIIDLEEIAEKMSIRPKVAIRVNMNTEVYPQWSRFGFNLENDQAFQAIERIDQRKLLDLEGLHTHIGTFILDPHAYQIAIKKLVDFEERIRTHFGYKIRYLDLGGGFASKNHLKGMYQPPEIAVPKIEEYAETITSTLKQSWLHAELPHLYLETGRHMIDEAGFLATTVVSSKLLPDSRRAYVLDAGVNLLYTSTWYKPRVCLTQKNEGIPNASLLVGPLCMNIDVLSEALMLPRLEKGASLVLHPVGAYNVTQWMQFIQYRPAITLIRANGEVQLVRKAENLEYMNLCDLLPSDLNSL